MSRTSRNRFLTAAVATFALVTSAGAGRQPAGRSTTLVSDAARPLPLHERYNLSYARAVLSRPYIFTIVFLSVNFFIFLLMWGVSGTSSAVLWAGFPPLVMIR